MCDGHLGNHLGEILNNYQEINTAAQDNQNAEEYTTKSKLN